MTALQQDNAGNVIALNRTHIDMAGGDLASGILLSQLVYWHTPNLKGQSRLRIKKDGHWWLAKKRFDWWNECRLTPKQFDRASQILERLKIIVIRNYRFDGSPMKHLRISSVGFSRAFQFVTTHPGEVFTEAFFNNSQLVENSPNGNIHLPQRGKSIFPFGQSPSSQKGKVQLPQKEKSITETTTETTTETSSPLTPQLPEGKKEREIHLTSNNQQPEESNTQLVDDVQLGSSHLFLVQKDPSEESSSAAVSTNADNVTKCEVIPGASFEVTSLTVSQPRTKRYDRALGIESPENWKNLQQKQFDWVPDGPWLHSGKLDPNFVDWLAIDWQKQYGGTIHKKRSDVLRHFKKDPANIAIAWEQYRAEHLHRYENAALRMHNGLEIKPDEQQQLLTHARAVTNPLPDELNPVASAVETPQPLSSVSMSPPEAALIEEASRVGLAHVCESAIAHKNVVSGKTQLNAQLETKENNFFPRSPSACGETARASEKQCYECTSIPNDDDGNTENPEAYKQWIPKPTEDEPISPQQWLEKLATFTQELSMSKNQPEPQKSMESSDELEELNQWLCDPILCLEVMARVMRSDRYTVEFDELGNPYKVLAIRD